MGATNRGGAHGAGGALHPPKNGPFFVRRHFAETTELKGVQRLEIHGTEDTARKAACAMRQFQDAIF